MKGVSVKKNPKKQSKFEREKIAKIKLLENTIAEKKNLLQGLQKRINFTLEELKTLEEELAKLND